MRPVAQLANLKSTPAPTAAMLSSLIPSYDRPITLVPSTVLCRHLRSLHLHANEPPTGIVGLYSEAHELFHITRKMLPKLEVSKLHIIFSGKETTSGAIVRRTTVLTLSSSLVFAV